MPDMSVNGKPGKLAKIDETTVQFQFDEPYFLFYDMLAGDTLIGGGQSVRQAQGFTFGAYAPAHYLKQFLPKYSSEAEVNARAKAEGYDNWVKMIHFKKDWSLNKDVPLLETCVMVVATIYLIANTLADLSYAGLNPRIRYA